MLARLQKRPPVRAQGAAAPAARRRRRRSLVGEPEGSPGETAMGAGARRVRDETARGAGSPTVGEIAKGAGALMTAAAERDDRKRPLTGQAAGPSAPSGTNAVAGAAGRPAQLTQTLSPAPAAAVPMGDEQCPVSLRANAGSKNELGVSGGRLTMLGDFRVHARFPADCGCTPYEYRQFIRGQVQRRRGTTVENLGSEFAVGSAGSAGLTNSFVEDGDTTTGFRYGHRSDAPSTGTPRNFYADDNGDPEEGGCRYEGSDAPGLFRMPVRPGDVVEADIVFRGEIQRGGRTVMTRHWVGLRERFQVP